MLRKLDGVDSISCFQSSIEPRPTWRHFRAEELSVCAITTNCGNKPSRKYAPKALPNILKILGFYLEITLRRTI